MTSVSLDRAWLVHRPHSGLDASLGRAIEESGLRSTGTAHNLEMRGGSQWKLRILGSLFTSDSILPRGGTIQRFPGSDRSNAERITLHLEDRLRLVVTDPFTRKKYDALLHTTADRIEAAIRANADDVEEGLTPGSQ